ncbi:thioesterase family protein [Streptomyces sp. WI04-05B]|uniref:thioesterase family protein n=1 Tax=Streptomyces TaxID=1883 RepID=UPI00299FA129|nr:MULTISPECIES: thioesterase family protein [unclassified Streptomyces]MDX2544883.1 thioesterase family protein [Streptomyces sp. WI04-05B]MDX2588931.1 thioesterase family protein [Streptomyces sp. WI04-05A]MDX3750783.1 thioesterase family protein [Streptomyces sp. AK08-02]
MPMSQAEAFYEREADDRFLPTAYTRGPWDAGSQHAGPPAALLALAVEQRPGGRPDMRVARLTYEIMRPVPIRPLSVATRVLRAGRSVELVEVVLTPDGGQEVMRATALLVKSVPDSVPQVSPGQQVPVPGAVAPQAFFPVPWDQGYHTAMDVRFAAGSFLEPGPATAWMRMRVPLVAGEETTPLSRVLTAADSGNGVSAALDFRHYSFVNADLTVSLLRHPQGEWVCLDARTMVDGAGIGLAESALHDEKGPLGRSTQTLYVTGRS